MYGCLVCVMWQVKKAIDESEKLAMEPHGEQLFVHLFEVVLNLCLWFTGSLESKTRCTAIKHSEIFKVCEQYVYSTDHMQDNKFMRVARDLPACDVVGTW